MVVDKYHFWYSRDFQIISRPIHMSYLSDTKKVDWITSRHKKEWDSITLSELTNVLPFGGNALSTSIVDVNTFFFLLFDDTTT